MTSSWIVKMMYGSESIKAKLAITTIVAAIVIILAPVFGVGVTLIGLDAVLSLYLTSCFRGRLRVLFILHPFFVWASSLGFETPYNEIGTGFTYQLTFDRFVEPSSLAIDVDALLNAVVFGEGDFGIGSVYLGTIPILWLPKYLFGDASDIANYYSLSMFTMLYAAIGVSIAIGFGSIRRELLLAIALYSSMSPTFLEINSSMHRYGLLFLGTFIVLNAYMMIFNGESARKKIAAIILMALGLIVVALSKAAILLSLILFVVLERLSASNILSTSFLFNRLDRNIKLILLLIGIAIIQVIGQQFLPDRYVLFQSQKGGQFQVLSNLPIIGIIVRVIYAALSPFPILGFDEWGDYGNNRLFLIVHFFSAVLACWILISIVLRIRRIAGGDRELRSVVLFGVSILASLAFSAIGFHAYIAPALPYLSVVLIRRTTRASFLYGVGSIILMECAAWVARFTRG